MTNNLYDKYTCPVCGIALKRIFFLIDGECPVCEAKYTGVSLDELVIELARADERAKVLSEVDGVISFMLTQHNYGGRTLLELRAKLNQLKGTNE